MNAAAASGHQHTHQPANATAPPTVKSGQQGASSGQSGFVDLINLLLGTEPQAAAIDPGTQVDGQEADTEPSLPTLKTRSPQEIAAALIRSMSGRDRSFATNAFSDKSSSKSAQRKQNEASGNLAALFPYGAPVANLTAAQSIPAANLPLAQATRQNDAIQMKASATNGGSNAPVAFALKLTPKDVASEDSTSAQPETTADGHANADQSASSAAQEKTDIEVFPVGAAAEELPEAKARVALETSSVSGMEIHAAGPFSGSEISAAPIRSQPPTEPTAPPTSAEALRNSGIEAPAQGNPAGPAQEIAVRINRADQAVDVHVTERGGQVHVAVRTPDAGLQTSLRQDLGTLVRSLDRAGYHAETSAPLAVNSTESPSSQMNGNNSHQQQDSDSSSGRQSGGQPGGQQHERQPKHTSQDWMEAMENAQ